MPPADANEPVAGVLVVRPGLEIPTAEFSFTFVRSSGPGGQNVNKVNSKARLRWPVTASPSLPDDVKQRFVQRYARRMTAEGDLILTSQRYRDQARNIDDCLEKLRALLLDAAQPPAPRKKTRPTRGSQRRRLADKRQHSERKQMRRSPRDD